ncbi:PAS domain S-box protein [Pedobacter frigoris]|uniref:histidine kinase n=1 Tax=Pedobacter frigoris TaxID=2571272 RepID=A0A4U1CNZ8_9SPHI|nr:PAS domain S-box protein [Pedobacter frigoris]TKC09193.1 PAS domain S-box protein [Pedobacter frigoris]
MKNFKTLNEKINSHVLKEVELNDDIRQKELLIAVMQLAEERAATLTAIIESSEDAIISKNLEGIVTSWNSSAERIFGFSSEEMVGQSILKLIPQDRLEEEPHILGRLRAGERVEHFETKRVTKYGELIDVSLTISPVKNQAGEIIGVSKIARNITPLKRAEEKSAMLAAIIESTDDAIISKDLNSIITSWNISAERIFGYTEQEMIGESILKLIPPDRLQEEPMILGQLKSGQRVDHFETQRMTKQGKLIDVSLTISPVKDKAGNLIGLSKIARDITYKKLEEQRKNDFIAIVSHELKTPLTSMRSYIQLALAKVREKQDSFCENVLARAEVQTRKMYLMINDFLNLSRLEEGKMSLNLSRFNLTELIDEIVGDARILAPAHVIAYQNCDEVMIDADREKIGQVINNLLSNAVKYSSSGTTINVGCEISAERVLVSVADQGFGISSEDQKRLFNRFYRVSNDQIKNVSGFGIGLYLVSEILRLHGGKVKVESEQGKGSVFSFALKTA